MRRTLTVGMVGCGEVARTAHAPAIDAPGSRWRIGAIADTDPARLSRLAPAVAADRRFRSFDELLATAGAELDAVVLCTPPAWRVDAVVRVLEAGLHVLVEKPLSLSLDEADALVGAANAHAGQVAIVGFNQRHHRVSERARAILAAGTLGPVHELQTAWFGPSVEHAADWRDRRDTGGGALADLFVHQVDLIQWLTGATVTAVDARVRQGRRDDEAASIVSTLSSGARWTAHFGAGAPRNDLTVAGERGRLRCSLYSAGRFRLDRRDAPGGRTHAVLAAAADVARHPAVFLRGGPMPESYRRLWAAFAEAVDGQTTAGASFAEGRAAQRVVLAAMASAEAGGAVAVEHAPRTAPPPVRASRLSIGDEPAAPALSAVIATMGSFEVIARTVRHLAAQTARRQIELVIVCPDASQLALPGRVLEGFHSHQVVEIAPFRSVAIPNAAGARAARAPVVAFCEDHAFPDPAWAEALLSAHRGPYAVVGPAVHNANPATLTSRADFLIGYGPWAAPIASQEPAHLPGHNSAYKRAVLLEYGARLEDMLEAESVLQWDLVARGHRLWLEPEARLAHTNFSQFGVWTRVQVHAGRVFGGTRALGWSWPRRLFFAAASPLIPLVRLRRLWPDASRLPRDEGRRLAVLATVAWGLVFDGLGQAAGYLTGTGRSRSVAHEFARVDYVTTSDRDLLAKRD